MWNSQQQGPFQGGFPNQQGMESGFGNMLGAFGFDLFNNNFGPSPDQDLEWDDMEFDQFYENDENSSDDDSDENDNLANPLLPGFGGNHFQEDDDAGPNQFADGDSAFFNSVFEEDPVDLEINQEQGKMLRTKDFNYNIQKKEKDFGDDTEDEDADNDELDGQGEEREWNNWVVPTYTSKRQALNVRNMGYGNKLGVDDSDLQFKSMIKSSNFVAESQEYNNLRLQYEQSGQKYSDPQFPARHESVWGNGGRHIPEDVIRRMIWQRPEQIFQGQPYTIFDEDIKPDDVRQGILGDCYLLAAMAAIAEHQDRIKRLFLQRTPTPSGAYCVALCLNGIWEDVIIDDQIPCRPDNRQIAFTHTKKNELWAVLIEKAWAKVHGGYMNIEGGLIKEALRDLTGAPCKTFFLKQDNPELLWKRICEAEDRQWIMCAASADIRGYGTDAQDAQTGLSGNHAYSVLAAYEIEENGGQKRVVPHTEQGSPQNTRILKMRNPWAKGEWKGPWSDADRQNWTPEIKELLDQENKDDGVFYLPFNAFLKYFHDFQICFYDEDAQYSAQKYRTSATRPTIIEFDVEKEGDYYITVNQINRRFFRPQDSKCSIKCFLENFLRIFNKVIFLSFLIFFLTV